MKKKAQVRLLVIFGLIMLASIIFVTADIINNEKKLPPMPIGEKVENIDGLNVIWEHIKTNDLSVKEFKLEVYQEEGYNSERTISPNLLLANTNFNLSLLDSNDLEIKAYQYQESIEYFYNYTKIGICEKLINSSVEQFEVYSASELNYKLYNVGDIVIYNSHEYKCKQTIYNYNGLPPSLPQYWEDLGLSTILDNSTNLTNTSEWNYDGCILDGEEIIIENKEIKYSDGSLCVEENTTCILFNITIYVPIQIGSDNLPVSDSMFKEPIVMKNDDNTETLVGNISLNKIIVPPYSNSLNSHKYFLIKIRNIPIDRTNGIHSTGTFLVNIDGNYYWDKTHSSWWNESWNYYKEYTNLTGNITYMVINQTVNDNSDWNDTRFLSCYNDTLVFNHTLEAKLGSYGQFRINNKGENCTLRYYGNENAISTSSASDVYFNPISAYFLDANANDFVGSNHGTVNGATLSSGYINGSYDFDGINDYIDLTNSFSLSNELTYCAWINTDVSNDGNFHFIVGKGGTSGGEGKMYLTTDGYIGAYPGAIKGTTQLSTGVWYFACITIDSSNIAKVYVNEGLENSGTMSRTSSTTSVYIGKDTGGTGQYFNGKIDEVLIYNSIKTPDEIYKLYTQTAPNIIEGTEQQQITSTCTYSSGNWNISLADYCVISSPVNLTTNNMTFYGTGNITINSTVTLCEMGGLPANQTGYVGSEALVNYGFC